jgi:hypothetical protein
MTDLHIEGPPGDAGATMSGVYRGSSDSASLISSAELADRDTTELIELRRAVAAGARAGDDEFVDWCTRTDKLIVAELYLRTYVRAAIDAKAAVIIDEERRLACGAR